MAYYILKSYKLNADPFSIFEVLKDEKDCFFLDSSLNLITKTGSFSRYSFLGIDPFYILEIKAGDTFSRLREDLDKYRFSFAKSRIPFLGGAVGYLSYDLGLAMEDKIKTRPKKGPAIPGSFFSFYNTVVIIDHFQSRLYILSIGFPEKRYHLAKALCELNFKRIYSLLNKVNAYKPVNIRDRSRRPKARLKSNFSKQDYIRAIKKAKEYIKEGDIYQVNLSQEFNIKTEMSGFEVYRQLRRISPACFSAYFDTGDFQILSSSPERFLKLSGRRVITRPMKGTRPRCEDKRKDAYFKRDLMGSAKDKAELLMIVDLERNDLGKVCNYDSIKVTQLRELEEYSTVFQTTSTIEGVLYKNRDRIDLLRATFPGGSITGCPKIRAMEIIEELEPLRRSIYTGIFGYLSFSGDMDFNILIRTILKKKDKLYFGVGGGIVADSNPEDEYQETLVKAKAMIEAIS